MMPSLRHNDLILIKERKKILINDIVVFDICVNRFIVKRVQYVSRNFITVRGDNPKLESSICDSDVNKRSVVGTVVIKIRTKMINFLGYKFLVPTKISLP